MTPFFLPGSMGELFALHFSPVENRRNGRGVLLFPPFAEELNKSRRMLSLQARYLADRGYDVLMLDLFGTGDSQGEFHQARWEVWSDDICRGVDWLLRRNIDDLVFLALRLGTLLAVDIVPEYRNLVKKLIFWQPVINGQVFMNQFLRLRLAAEMTKNTNRLTMKELRKMLDDGQIVEVAGYGLPPELVMAIEQKNLMQIKEDDLPVISWINIVGDPSRPLSFADAQIVQKWKNNHAHVDASVVTGEPFWGTTEITVVPELLSKTCDAI